VKAAKLREAPHQQSAVGAAFGRGRLLHPANARAVASDGRAEFPIADPARDC
jgi:hypothetical protein